MPAIQVSHLSKTYESWKKQPGFSGTLKSLFHREKIFVPAVKDCSFSIEEGEFVGFIGPNGAGKTTTLKMLSGILWPSSGSASVLGHVPWKREPAYQRQFSIVLGQKNQLWWDLPAHDTFLLNKEIYEIPTRTFESTLKELGEALEVQHLFEIPVRKLSLGERMKCELVNALLHHPRLLFLDEPTIGLDVVSQKTIRDFLRTWNQKEGATVILTSHAMADVEILCPRVIVIHHGQLHYDGELKTLVDEAGKEKEVRLRFHEKIAKKDLTRFGRITDCSGFEATLQVDRGEVGEILKVLLNDFPVADVSVEEIAFEEVVRKLFLQQTQTHP